jgi:hypothetical protein
MSNPMSNGLTILQVLAFLGTVALVSAAAVGAAWAFFNGKLGMGRFLAIGSGGLALSYVSVLLLAGALSTRHLLPASAEKYFCELDCHLAYTVTEVRTSESVGAGADVRRAEGRFWLVTVRTRFDENTISARRSLTAPTWPAPRRLGLVGVEGTFYPPVPDMDGALKAQGVTSTPITQELPPGASYTTTFVFDLPPDAAIAGLLLTDDILVTRLLIGNERSPFHAPTLLTLPPASVAVGD